MGGAKKLIEAMARNPRDWTMDDVRTVARHAGLTVSSPGGSHHILRNAQGRKVSIPAHRPIKPVYIKALLQMIAEGSGEEE